MSRNEVESTNPYSRKLFIRLERGYYLLNPELDVLIDSKWKNVYDVMRIEKIKKHTEEEKIKKLQGRLLSDIKEIEYYEPELAKKLRKNIPSIETKNQFQQKKVKILKQIKEEGRLMWEKEIEERKKKWDILNYEKEKMKKEKEEKKRKADEAQFELPF